MQALAVRPYVNHDVNTRISTYYVSRINKIGHVSRITIAWDQGMLSSIDGVAPPAMGGDMICRKPVWLLAPARKGRRNNRISPMDASCRLDVSESPVGWYDRDGTGGMELDEFTLLIRKKLSGAALRKP